MPTRINVTFPVSQWCLLMHLFTTVPHPHGHRQLQELLGNNLCQTITLTMPMEWCAVPHAASVAVAPTGNEYVLTWGKSFSRRWRFWITARGASAQSETLVFEFLNQLTTSLADNSDWLYRFLCSFVVVATKRIEFGWFNWRGVHFQS